MRKIALIPLFIISVLLLAACGSHKSAVGVKKPGKEKPGAHGDTVSVEEPAVRFPDKDLRAVWIATIGGLDWPRKRYGEEQQKALYRQYLDTLQRLNINAVFFQVRPRADAFYKSEYEPWSMYLTWRRDTDPGYDVLRWLIDETHGRGMAFHAWMNPYRVGTRKGRRDRFAPLDRRIPKSLVKDYANVRIYNPALPETRRRVCDVVRDLLTRYDVDGIHFDDYFYPELAKGEKMNDGKEYRKYGQGFANVEDFRRAMVDSLVFSVNRAVKEVNKNAVFSISPQGNYQNNYCTMYADVAKWSRLGWCDLVIPQLYWSTEKYFPERLRWFADSCAQRSKLAIGYALYRFDGKSRDPYFRTADDLAEQFRLAYGNKNVSGGVLYSAHWLLGNPMNVNAVIARRFSHLALLPYLGQDGDDRPASPEVILQVSDSQSVKSEMDEVAKRTDSIRVAWRSVPGCYYAVYHTTVGCDDAELVAITYDTSVALPANGRYYVSAVRRGDNAESEPVRAY